MDSIFALRKRARDYPREKSERHFALADPPSAREKIVFSIEDCLSSCDPSEWDSSRDCPNGSRNY
jgi:hypothetical protein